jgi:hypothetical protein
MFFYGKQDTWLEKQSFFCSASKCTKHKQQTNRTRPCFKSSLRNIDVLCFTEHWVQADNLKLIQIDQYKLANYFSRKKYNHGGSCMYVKQWH